MNELIRELKLEAAQWARQNHQVVDPENLTKQEYEKRVLMMIDKFAELIVRECADRVSKMVMRDKFDIIPKDPHSQGWNDAVAYAGKELKKSFGVEE